MSSIAQDIRIAVIGAGAIGGCLAAALGDAGHVVSLCVRTPFEKLIRTLQGETKSYAHPVLTDVHGLAQADWVLLCTKAHQTESTRPWLERLVGPGTRVAVLQNGVEHVERVRPFVAEGSQVLPCVILLPASALSAGTVEQAQKGALRAPAGALADEFARLFAGQDAVTVKSTADFVSAAWSKLVLNATGGICALALKPLGAMIDPVARDLVTGLIHEIVAVGAAEGAVFPDGYVEQVFNTFTGPIEAHWTSIAADRRDGKAMEWDARNAVVGRLGRKHGIATPLNDALTALLALSDTDRPT